jgi:hypothetical protein
MTSQPSTNLPASGSAKPASTTTAVSKGYRSCQVPPLSDNGSDYGQWGFCTELILEPWLMADGTSPGSVYVSPGYSALNGTDIASLTISHNFSN